jgi:hypothetical protein
MPKLSPNLLPEFAIAAEKIGAMGWGIEVEKQRAVGVASAQR